MQPRDGQMWPFPGVEGRCDKMRRWGWGAPGPSFPAWDRHHMSVAGGATPRSPVVTVGAIRRARSPTAAPWDCATMLGAVCLAVLLGYGGCGQRGGDGVAGMGPRCPPWPRAQGHRWPLRSLCWVSRSLRMRSAGRAAGAGQPSGGRRRCCCPQLAMAGKRGGGTGTGREDGDGDEDIPAVTPCSCRRRSRCSTAATGVGTTRVVGPSLPPAGC